MKKFYWRLSKKDKKLCKKNYYASDKGKSMNIILTRLCFTGILGVLVALYIVVNNYVHNQVDWSTWVASIPLFIASVVFIISSFYLRFKNLNLYAIKNMKQK